MCIFCPLGLLAEKRKDYLTALEYYGTCNSQSKDTLLDLSNQYKEMSRIGKVFAADLDPRLSIHFEEMTLVERSISYLREVRGEALLRMAIVKKDLGAHGQALQMCDEMLATGKGDPMSNTLKANVMCLKVGKLIFIFILVLLLLFLLLYVCIIFFKLLLYFITLGIDSRIPQRVLHVRGHISPSTSTNGHPLARFR